MGIAIPVKKNNEKLHVVTVNKNMKDYGNEPYFVKKTEAARAFLKKHGLPAGFDKK